MIVDGVIIGDLLLPGVAFIYQSVYPLPSCQAYEDEVRSRGSGLNRSLHSLFDTLAGRTTTYTGQLWLVPPCMPHTVPCACVLRFGVFPKPLRPFNNILTTEAVVILLCFILITYSVSTRSLQCFLPSPLCFSTLSVLCSAPCI